MATTIVFVHGTGVRNDKTHQRLREGLTAVGRGDIEVVEVPWGDELGVSFSDDDINRIIAPAAKSLGDDGDKDVLWEMLLEDPLFELGLMAIKADPAEAESSGIGGGGETPLESYQRVLKGMSPEAPFPDGVTAVEIKTAGKWLVNQDVLASAVNAAGSASDDGLVNASARALAAHIMSNYDPYTGDGPLALYSGAARDELVDHLERTISPTRAKSVGDWVKRHTVDALKNWGKRRAIGAGTKLGRRHRTSLMDFATPFTGDILSYQQRGEPFRKMIIDVIDGVSPDHKVVLVGHSLGGVILVDVACEVTREISYLITVGSQPSFFLLADSLGKIRKGQDYGDRFPDWLNIFDRNDFLSFRAKSLFSMLKNLEDEEASSGVGFPASHGAYWRNDKVFKLIADKCPE